jgi:hypothetical protein
MCTTGGPAAKRKVRFLVTVWFSLSGEMRVMAQGRFPGRADACDAEM